MGDHMMANGLTALENIVKVGYLNHKVRVGLQREQHRVSECTSQPHELVVLDLNPDFA